MVVAPLYRGDHAFTPNAMIVRQEKTAPLLLALIGISGVCLAVIWVARTVECSVSVLSFSWLRVHKC